MTPFKVACEHCEASFKINDASRIGKRVKCPKCGEAFTIRGPAAEEDEFEDAFNEAPATRSRRMPGKSGGGRARKAEKKEGSPVGLWVGGGIGLAVGLFAILWMTGLFSGAAPAAPVAQAAAPPPQPVGPAIGLILDRLPRETEVVVHLRFKDALASPLAAGLRTPEFDAQLSSPNPLIPGTTLAGMETATFAISNLTLQISEQKRLGDKAPPPAPGGMPFPVEPLILVTLNDPLTPEFLNLPPESAVKHGSTTIYRRPQPIPFAPPCLAIIDPKVVALGSEQQLKALIDQPSGNGAAADFQLLDGKSHLAIAMCPRNIVQQVERLAVNSIEIPKFHRELNQFVGKGGKGVALQLTLTSDLEAGVSVQATDSAKLAEVQATLEAQVKQARDNVNAPAAASDPMRAALKPVAEGIKVVGTGDRACATAVVPKDTLLGLGQLGMMMAGPAMMNLGPPPGRPRGTPPAAP